MWIILEQNDCPGQGNAGLSAVHRNEGDNMRNRIAIRLAHLFPFLCGAVRRGRPCWMHVSPVVHSRRFGKAT